MVHGKTLIWIFAILTMLVSFAGAVGEYPDSNPLSATAVYHLDNKVGNAIIDSTDTINLSYSDTKFRDSIINQSVYGLSGAAPRSGLVNESMPFTWNATTNLTISVWFNQTNAGTWSYILQGMQPFAGGAPYYPYYRWRFDSSEDLKIDLHDGNSQYTYDAGNGLADGLFHHLVVTIAGDTCTQQVYIDNVNLDNGSIAGCSHASNPIAAQFTIGGFYGSNTDSSFLYPIIGAVDEVIILPYIASVDNVNDLYTGSYAAPAAPLHSNVSIWFSNKTSPFIYKTVFAEGENFFTSVNYSLSNGSQVTDVTGECNLSIYEGIEEEAGLNKDITLCSHASCDADLIYENYSFTYDTSESLINEDTILIKQLCKFGGTLPVNITYTCDSGIPLAPVTGKVGFSNDDIPMCSAGNVTGTISIGNACRFSKGINLTISSYETTYNKRKFYHELEIDREYAVYDLHAGSEINYNSSTSLWATHPFSSEFYEHGTQYVNASCAYFDDNTFDLNVQDTLTIINAPPSIFFNGVFTSLGFVNSSLPLIIEFTDAPMNFSGVVIDDDLVHFNVTWYNSSGGIIQENNTLIGNSLLQVNTSLFVEFANPYNLSVRAVDSGGNMTILSVLFNVTDTIIPVMTGFNNVSVNNGSSVVWNANMTDEYLWSFYLSCDNGYSFNKTGIASNFYNFQNSTTITGNTLCSWNLSDGHTNDKIKDFKVLKDNNKLALLDYAFLSFDDVKFEVLNDVNNFSYFKQTDRYSYCISTSSSSKELTLLMPDGCVEAQDSDYLGHLVCGNKWVDFENTDGFSVNVTSTQIHVTSDVNTKEWCFNSIGELNTLYGNQTITLNPANIYVGIDIEESWSIPFNIGSTAGVLLLFFYLALCITIFIMGMILRVPVLIIFAGIMFMFLGWVIAANASLLFGILTILWGLFIIMIGGFSAN